MEANQSSLYFIEIVSFLTLIFFKIIIITDDSSKYILLIKNLQQNHCHFYSSIYLCMLFVTLLWISVCFQYWFMSLMKAESVGYNIVHVIHENLLRHEWDYVK